MTKLAVSASLVKEARSLGINVTQAADDGIALAIKQAKERAWLVENADAIRAHNERIDKHGTILKPIWLEN